MKEPEVNLNLALEHGLTEEEYGWICERLGRVPTFTELGIFSVMWSEQIGRASCRERVCRYV